jgi:hypothetical protein
MTNEEKFRKALIEGRNFRGNMIKISEVMEVCDFVDEEDLLAFIEGDGFKIVHFRMLMANAAIDNAAFSVLDHVKCKTRIALLHYKKEKGRKRLAILQDGHIFICEDKPGITSITFILKIKPI